MKSLTLARCSEHFTLSEMTTTSTGLLNNPDEEELRNLVVLCETVLEPWREYTGPLAVTSGFRSESVNSAVGGARGSQHKAGQAADVKPLTVTLEYAWEELLSVSALTVPVDQAVVYVRPRGLGWIHVSCCPGRQPRRQFLVQPNARTGAYLKWESWDGALVL